MVFPAGPVDRIGVRDVPSDVSCVEYGFLLAVFCSVGQLWPRLEAIAVHYIDTVALLFSLQPMPDAWERWTALIDTHSPFGSQELWAWEDIRAPYPFRPWHAADRERTFLAVAAALARMRALVPDSSSRVRSTSDGFPGTVSRRSGIQVRTRPGAGAAVYMSACPQAARSRAGIC
ncbi:hypothetical protein DICSQDRAFT_179300 [Dichomitus squalens LYAD-421 SS1]|uniref:uncharacterized protein n=1 Tax=Dichomitus squalens (strain LYAD-421) TaxID=732165 RepID=UPI0004415EF5|nr:uncharacterized protein DICSQDRAFT_179300 [Dichomitus squalens LYAD-421 SS1]EJF63306.1 hypothetical protein DICSQDRAFT_179300 [Dichomitus squalens LYAD-421 SS1]